MNDVMKQFVGYWEDIWTLIYFQAQPKPQFKSHDWIGSEKQEQQQQIVNLENWVIVKIYDLLLLFLFF